MVGFIRSSEHYDNDTAWESNVCHRNIYEVKLVKEKKTQVLTMTAMKRMFNNGDVMSCASVT